MSKKQQNKLKQNGSSQLRMIVEGVLVAILILLLGQICWSYAFANRIPSHVRVGLFPVSGLETSRVLAAMNTYEEEFLKTNISIRFRGHETRRTFRELGIDLNKEETAAKIRALAGKRVGITRTQVIPVLSFHDDIALAVLQEDFKEYMMIPQNSTLSLDGKGNITILPAKNGEHIDMISLDRDITEAFSRVPLKPVTASAVQAVPEVREALLEESRVFATSLLRSGFRLNAVEDRTFTIPARMIADMITFTNSVTPVIEFDDVKLRAYLTEHIAPELQKDPVNARFQMQEGKVGQFALPEDGRSVDIDTTVRSIQDALLTRTQTAGVALTVTHPRISDTGDSERLGITTLLAVGESDFRGSPKNRVKNIEVGTSRYNGILIAPNEEFSFNSFLGPVTKEAGFAPELVIKNNVTTPEFGGGLCQVSSTVFRAAVNSGMKITSRRNHSYAVRYYGTPGFDATIYPPYTDFRFLNNTPGYILIQTKIDGTKLSFEFWGTDDNRSVVIDGPHPYNRQPDGAVKAVLKQTVTKENGESLIEDTFYSNYRSPNLFPHT